MKKEKPSVLIRAIHHSDLPDINEIRRLDGVREYTTGITSERLEQTEEWFKRLSSNDHLLVAEKSFNGRPKVVGMVQLNVKSSPRIRHVGEIGISVHTAHQNQGIGRELMENILDLADNWLNLTRVQLTVISLNEQAVGLYKSLGFSVEGTLKYAQSFKGAYVDSLMMARYRINQ